MGEQTVSVGEFSSRDEAHIVEGMLRAHGIEAATRLEDAGGAYPQLAARVQGGTSVHVPAAQAGEALELLADVERSGPGQASDGVAPPEAGAQPRRVRWGRWVLLATLFGLPALTWLVDRHWPFL